MTDIMDTTFRSTVTLHVWVCLACLATPTATGLPQDPTSLEAILMKLGCADGFIYKEDGCKKVDVESVSAAVPRTNTKVNKTCPADKEYIDILKACIHKLPSKPDPKDCKKDKEDLKERINDIGLIDVDLRREGNLQISDTCIERKCSDLKDEGYECAPSYACRNSTIITDGSAIITIRKGGNIKSDQCCVEPKGVVDLSDYKCEKRGVVCCKHPNRSLKPCGIKTEETCRDDEKKKEYEKCGRIITETDLKFISGENSTDKNGGLTHPGEFPHMCLIYRLEKGAKVYMGGASMIDRNKFITVAHKLYSPAGDVDYRFTANIYVRCGEHNNKQEDDILETQDSSIVKVHIHPEYNPNSLENNIAILETLENLIYQKHIGRVCLPQPGLTYEGQTECFSTGWGASNLPADGKQAAFSDILKKVKLAVVNRRQCERQLNDLPRLKEKKLKFILRDSWMCIGGETGDDTCEGDGGSPHVCNINNKWVQVGAVAFGFGCGEKIPAIYSSVSDAMCWIDWVMSCVPLARSDVNFKTITIENVDPRRDRRKSYNSLFRTECQKWLNNHQQLKLECDIDYE